MNVVACPSCSKHLQYNPQQAGKQVRCPACQTVMVLPGAPNPSPSPNQPVQPLPSGSQQVPPGGQQLDPLQGQQPFSQTPAAYPQSYPANPQTKQAHKKKKGVNPVVLWGSIGGGVLVVIVILAIALGGGGGNGGSSESTADKGDSKKDSQGQSVSVNKQSASMIPSGQGLGAKANQSIFPIPDYFVAVEPTQAENNFKQMHLLQGEKKVFVYESEGKPVNKVIDWFKENIPKNGWDLNSGPGFVMGGKNNEIRSNFDFLIKAQKKQLSFILIPIDGKLRTVVVFNHYKR